MKRNQDSGNATFSSNTLVLKGIQLKNDFCPKLYRTLLYPAIPHIFKKKKFWVFKQYTYYTVKY